MIGDADPEDAYDASDPVDVRLAVIARAIISARSDGDRRTVRLEEIARLLRVVADELVDG